MANPNKPREIKVILAKNHERLLAFLHNLSPGKEVQRGTVLPRRKHVAVKRSRGVISGTSRGAKIRDTEEIDIRTSSCPPTPEINKVQEALRTSSLELQAVVKDPLPDALQLAGNVISSMGRENMNQESLVVGQNGVDVAASNPSVDRSVEAAQANEANLSNQCSRHQDDVPKPSLMAHNSTARTCEWDDSIDASPEGSLDRGSRLHLPTPKRRLVSPLKKYEITKFARRRKIKKWSTLEEDTLRTGVQKYGKGNWKLILHSYRDIFEERTEVDLKDKWRNMIHLDQAHEQLVEPRLTDKLFLASDAPVHGLFSELLSQPNYIAEAEAQVLCSLAQCLAFSD